MGEGFIFLNAFQNSWGVSSAGRAPPWHGGGSEFDPRQVHQHNGGIAQLVEQPVHTRYVEGSTPPAATICFIV